MTDTAILPDNTEYNCICCDYTTTSKIAFNKHQLTKKHKQQHLIHQKAYDNFIKLMTSNTRNVKNISEVLRKMPLRLEELAVFNHIKFDDNKPEDIDVDSIITAFNKLLFDKLASVPSEEAPMFMIKTIPNTIYAFKFNNRWNIYTEKDDMDPITYEHLCIPFLENCAELLDKYEKLDYINSELAVLFLMGVFKKFLESGKP